MIDAKGRVVVSNSTLRDVATCTTADVMRHAEGWTGVDLTGPRTLGSVWHEVVETYFKTSRADLALVQLDLKYKPFSDRVCVPETWIEDGVTKSKPNRCRYENVRRVAEAWLDAHPLDGLAYRVDPKLVEVSFMQPLGPYHIRGRLDAIVEDDGLWVLENKTTGRLDANFWRQWRMDSALTGYCWAAEAQLGESIRGCIVEGVEMKEVPGSTRKCPNHGVPYAECGSLHLHWGMERFERTPQDISEWRVTALDLAEKHEFNMRAGQYVDVPRLSMPQEGKFHGACYKYEGFAACDFARWCEAGRPREFSGEMFDLERVKEH